MTEKRFKIVHLRDMEVCDIQDTAQDIPTFYSDLTYNFGSAELVCDLLNDQDSKIVKFESAVKSAIVNERTDLGRSVLKQLAESLDIDF